MLSAVASGFDIIQGGLAGCRGALAQTYLTLSIPGGWGGGAGVNLSIYQILSSDTPYEVYGGGGGV